MIQTQPARTIAVVDDDAFMLRLLSALIGRVGDYAVEGFQDAARACDAVTAPDAAYEVLILDLNMPGMDGIEFLGHLARGHCRCPLILFSGESQNTLRSAAAIAQAHGLSVLGTLAKPPTLEALARLLRQAQEEQVVASMTEEQLSPAELLDAVATERIFCLYQPVQNLRDSGIVGADVRLRWNHPQYGELGPNTFMRVAQRFGMGALLTRESLDMALRAQRAWRDAGRSLRVAIRVGGDALADAGFADFVGECAARHAVDPESVVLRLRSADVMDSEVVVSEALTRLRLRRFQLALDDFGSGGVPLLRLAELGLAAVRVSPAVLEQARQGGAGVRVLQACADVAARLGMRAVVGGVVSEADKDLCRDCGFELADGSGVARPLSASALARWLDAGAASTPR